MARDNFTQRVKDELCSTEYSKEELKYILSGFLRNSSTFSLGRNPTIHVRTEIGKVAALLYKAFSTCYSLKPRNFYEQTPKFKRSLSYHIECTSPELYSIMEDLEILKDGIERIPSKEGLKKDNFKFLLIGLFLASGSVNNPSTGKTSYFLEISFSSKKEASTILRKLLSFKNERTMNFKMIQRRQKYVLYLKRSDQISVFLSYIGATDSMFQFENIRIMKDDNNTNNRLTIAVYANYGKTLKTAKRDIEDIEYLLKDKPLALFDERTRKVIECRMNNQDSSYRELAEMLTEEGMEITKSGVVHVISAIREEAKEKREREE